MASSSSTFVSRKFTYADFCTLITAPSSQEMLEKQKKKVHELTSKWFQSQPKNSIILRQISQGGWRKVSKEVDAKLLQGLDPFDYFFPNSETDTETLTEYAAYSTYLQDSSASDKAILEKLDPELKKLRQSPCEIFNHFYQMTGEERHLGLAICYSAGIGTNPNLELAACHAEKAQDCFLPRFAALRYARILEELVLSPKGDQEKKELYKAKLFALYEKAEETLFPTLMLRYARLIQFGSLDLIAKDRLSEGNAAHLLGKMCLDRYASDNTHMNLLVMGMGLLTHAGKLCNYPKALEDLAALQESGKGIVQNHQEAFKNYSASFQLGNLAASYPIARCYEYSIGTDQHELKALNHYMIALQSGIDQAALDLGRMHEEGIGTRIDLKKALEYYRIAKDKQIPGALEKYASALAKGFGGDGKRKEGIDLLEQEVTKKNSATAMYELSRIYHLEKGPLRNRSNLLLRDAALLGHQDALFYFGLSYLHEGTTSDQAASRVQNGLYHLKNAAKSGSTKAMFQLATYSHPVHRKKDSAWANEVLDWAEKGIQCRDACCATVLGRTFYDKGILGLQRKEPDALQDIETGIQYYEYAASWGSKRSKVILIKHYLANNQLEKIWTHLRSLTESPNNPPDVLAALAEFYATNELGEEVDLQKATQYVNEAIELITAGKVEEQRTLLNSCITKRENYDRLIKKQKDSLTQIAKTISPDIEKRLKHSIKDLFLAEKQKESAIINHSGLRKEEIGELIDALEAHFKPFLEQIDQQQEKQIANLVTTFMNKYQEYYSSPSQKLINPSNGKKIDYMITSYNLLTKLHKDFKIEEKIREMNKGWQSIKASMCERYEEERRKLETKSSFTQWIESSQGEICDKFTKYVEKLRQKSGKTENSKTDFLEKLQSLKEAGLLAIERGQSAQEVREEIEALILKMRVGLDAKLELVVSSSSSSSSREGEELNAKFNELQRTLSATQNEMHHLERTARQTEERLLKQIEELKRAHALEREQQKLVEERLRKENRELQAIVQTIPVTASVEILEKRINQRIGELRIKGMTTLKGYALNNFPPRKYHLDGLETILSGLGFERQGEANGSHRHYERGEESIGLSPHNSDEADKAQIQQVLKFLLADLNTIE